MRKVFYIVILVVSSSAIFTQEDEELEVKGNVLFKDRVTSLNPPVPIINVPQTVSIITDEDILERGYRAISDIVRYVPGVVPLKAKGIETLW